MRIVSWNVNSLKVRLPRVEEFLDYADADVICIQETKLADKAFPALTFQEHGYESVHNGQGQWNGVAILSRVGIEDVRYGFGESITDPYEGDARLIAAKCDGVDCVSVYVPNGREVPSEFYDRKLVWLEALRTWLAAQHSCDDPVVIVGDFNVAPQDRDVWDIRKFDGSTHVTVPERAAISSLCEWGMTDAFRAIYPDDDRLYTYWDYRAGDFHEHRGMRIDLALVSDALRSQIQFAIVDRNARKGKLPSDHAPLIIDIAREP